MPSTRPNALAATLALLLCAAVTDVLRADDDPTLTLRYWPATEAAAAYPEQGDTRFSYLWQRRNFGIAFSGGGIRSAAAVWGQLRGLEHLGWIDHARYLSGVSGGAWTLVPYSFLDRGCDVPGFEFFRSLDFDCREASPAELDAWFLEPFRAPEQLTNAVLANEDDSYIEALSRTQLLRLYLARLPIRGDETYSRALGKRLLNAVGQYDCQPQDPSCDPRRAPKYKYFAAHAAQVDRLVRDNPSLTADDFATLVPDRPFMIASTTSIARKRFATKAIDRFPVEITPLYIGSPTRSTDRFGRFHGGGFIDPPGWDSDAYTFHELAAGDDFGTVDVVKRPSRFLGLPYRYRMTLSDILGGTGAAPALTFQRLGISFLGLPQWDAPEIDESTTRAPERAFGDGGFSDNLGLVPLLGRGVENILVFVNLSRPARTTGQIRGWCDRPRRQQRGPTDVHKALADIWLSQTDPDRPWHRQPLLVSTNEDETTDCPRKAIRELDRAIEEDRSAGKPQIHCGTYRVLDNPRLGIQAYRAKICWVFLSKADAWAERLPPQSQLREQLLRKKLPLWARYKRFPHYGTFFHRWFKLRIIDMSEQQVNALAHLTAWTIVSSAEDIGPVLGLPVPRDP